MSLIDTAPGPTRMNRLAIITGFFGAAIWLILSVAVAFGAQPNKWVVFISFLSTAVSLLKEGVGARLEYWKKRL